MHFTLKFVLTEPCGAVVPRVNGKAKAGSFLNEPEPIAAIDDYPAVHNTDAKSFVWHTTAQALLDKIVRCKAILLDGARRP